MLSPLASVLRKAEKENTVLGGQEKDNHSKGNSSIVFCYQTKNSYKKKIREIFLEIKLSVMLVKGQMQKKKFQSIYIQIHMSAQLLSSSITDADYLAPDSASVDLLLCQLTCALIPSFPIIPLALLTIHG